MEATENYYCLNCSKKRLGDVTIIIVSKKDTRVVGRCRKCGCELIRVQPNSK